MLHPVQAKKLDRPISCLSHPKLCTGQVIWDSSAVYQEVIVTPDPFNFLTLIRSTGTSGSVVLGAGVEEDFALLNSNDTPATILSGTSVNWTMQVPLPLGSDLSLESTLLEGVPDVAGSRFYGFLPFDNSVNLQTCASYPLQQLAATTYTMAFRNRIQTTQVVQAFVGKISKSTKVYTEFNVGGATNALPAQLTNCTVTVAGAFNSTADEQLVIGVRQVLSGTHKVNDFGIEFVNVDKTLTTTNATNTTEVYSIGDAVYGKTSGEAAQLDALFSEANLWSPVALSALFNVDQLLKDAGGRFQVALLPSFIQQKLPTALEDTWNAVAGLSRSYPVAEAPYTNGSHGSWVGMRIQDYEWRKPFERTKVRNYDANSLPILHFISRQVSNTTSFKYYLSFHCCLEVQTVDPRIDMTWGASPSSLVPQLMSLFAKHGEELVGHNPDHFQRIKSLAKKAWADPTIRNILMTAIKGSPALLGLLL
jgi:hypothetical protein